ncbi:MAG: cation-transporting P-type ATPase, partial [Thermoflexales bacterium]
MQASTQAAESPVQSAIQLRAHSAPLAEIAAALQTDLQRGLSHDEAQRRLAQYGWNELPSAPPAPAWRRLLAQFESPLVLLLLAATAISLVVWLIEREASLPFESLAILAIVLFNAALGFIQEQRAERSLAALKTMAAATAS